MQDILNSLTTALEQLKQEAIVQIQNSASLEQPILDSLNGLKAYIAAFRQAHGL